MQISDDIIEDKFLEPSRKFDFKKNEYKIITNKSEYLLALSTAKYLCYISVDRTEWEELYYHRLTGLIVEYARIN